MAYATLTQLKDRLGLATYARLTDRAAGVTANDSVGQEVLDQAHAIADSYLSVRYATPVDLAQRPEVGVVLAARVLDVAEGMAWRGSPFVGDMPARVRYVASEGERWLRDVADGRVHLPAAAPPASRTASDDSPRFSGTERVLRGEELEEL